MFVLCKLLIYVFFLYNMLYLCSHKRNIISVLTNQYIMLQTTEIENQELFYLMMSKFHSLKPSNIEWFRVQNFCIQIQSNLNVKMPLNVIFHKRLSQLNKRWFIIMFNKQSLSREWRSKLWVCDNKDCYENDQIMAKFVWHQCENCDWNRHSLFDIQDIRTFEPTNRTCCWAKTFHHSRWI